MAIPSLGQKANLTFTLRSASLDAAGLRTVGTDIAAGFAWRPCAGHSLRAQRQDLFQHLMSEFMDNALNYMAGILDQVHDGKQDLSIGLAELR